MRALKYILISVFISSFIWMNAQDFGSNTINSPVDKEPIVVAKKGFDPDVSVTVGSSFTSFGPGFNSFGTFVMPEITFPVSKKFAVRAGIGFSNIFYTTPGSEGTIFSQNNLQVGSIYVSGLYQVNEKLTIAGTAYKTFDLAPKEDVVNPRALDFSNEGVNVNIDYQVTDRFSFNVGVSYQKQTSYNYFNGIPGSGFNMSTFPYGNSGFGSGFGPGF